MKPIDEGFQGAISLICTVGIISVRISTWIVRYNRQDKILTSSTFAYCYELPHYINTFFLIRLDFFSNWLYFSSYLHRAELITIDHRFLKVPY